MPSSSVRPRSAAQPSQASSVGTVTIDPVRLLKKYRWVFAGAIVVGAVIGVVAHYAFLNFHPIYKSSVIFELEGPKSEAAEAFENVDSEELERFMKTQAVAMTSQRVLVAFLETDPRTLSEEARSWASNFNDGGGNFDRVAAFEDLEDISRASVIPETQYIELSVRTQDAGDAAYLCGKIREYYMADLGAQEKVGNDKQQASIMKQITDLNTEITTLQAEREEILRDKGIQSVQENANQKYQEIQLVNFNLAEIMVERDAILQELSRYQQMLLAPGGVQYPDDIRMAIDGLPTIQYFIQTIGQVEAQIRTLRLAVGPEHMMLKRLEDTLAGQKAQLEATREEEMPRFFGAQIEQYSAQIAIADRQIGELDVRKEQLGKDLNELTRILRDINDMTKSIDDKQSRLNELEGKKSNLDALGEIAKTTDANQRLLYISRVRVVQYESVPDLPSFPQLKLMVPAGVFLFGGIVGVIVILRELLDQRVKGAADIALIPKTRVVGVITQAANDPSKPKAIETAFRDHPTGVIAEQFRQVRTHLQKRMQQSGHRTLLIVAGMPESGATTTAINLAMTFAAADKKVLLIDANLRRPAIHRVLALNEVPGLCDVLAGAEKLSSAIQRTDRENLDMLSVGSRQNRLAEYLAAETMGRLLAEASTEYDLVLLDTSPAIVSGDAMALANRCDASMLVVRALSEKRGLVARLRNELDESRGEFMGVLINGVRHAAGGYLKKNIQVTHAYQQNAEG